MPEMHGSVKVLLVDDHPVVREGMRAMLARDPQIEVIGEAGNAEEACTFIDKNAPEVVLMDIRMPGASGIEATRTIKRDHPSISVIIVTMHDSESYVVQAVQAGAAGFLVKDASRELLCHAIHAVLDGGVMIRSDLLRQAMRTLPHGPAHHRTATAHADEAGITEEFTEREIEILTRLATGAANRQIASELHLAEVTVKKHVQTIIAKLHASDRTQAAVLALRAGLIE